MLTNMDQLNFDLLDTRTGVPRDITKPQMWAMLQEMKQQLDSVNARAQDREEEMVTFSARIPKTLAQDIRRAAHLSGHKVQEVTAEALRFWLYAQQEDDLHR